MYEEKVEKKRTRISRNLSEKIVRKKKTNKATKKKKNKEKKGRKQMALKKMKYTVILHKDNV